MLSLLLAAANSDEYFVDFDDGADTNNGTSRNTPWKHCPGDVASVSSQIGFRAAVEAT